MHPLSLSTDSTMAWSTSRCRIKAATDATLSKEMLATLGLMAPSCLRACNTSVCSSVRCSRSSLSIRFRAEVLDSVRIVVTCGDLDYQRADTHVTESEDLPQRGSASEG